MIFFIPFMIIDLIIAPFAYSEVKTKCDQSVVIANEIPYGIKEKGLVAKGSVFTALFQVESRKVNPLAITYEIRIPKPIKPKDIPEDIKVEELKDEYLLTANFNLDTKFDKWYRTVEIYLPDKISEGDYNIYSLAQVAEHGKKTCIRCSNTALLEVVSKEHLFRSFAINRVLIPVNEIGEPKKKERKNSILMKRKRNAFISFLSREKGGEFLEPAAYAAVEIENKGRCHVPLLVTLKILDPLTRDEVKGFGPLLPPGHGGLSLKGIYRLVRIKPESFEKVVLPVYAEEGVTLAGKYLAQFELRHFGADTVLSRKEINIEVLASRFTPVLMTILALFVSLFAILWIYLMRRKILNLKTRDLITISMFGACIFAAVSLPGTIVWRFAHGILGPFSFLITGFFYEIVYYVLLSALVSLIPHVGVATLAIILRSLMTDIIFGGFSPMSLLNIGVTVIMSEAAFFICGITRYGASPNWMRTIYASFACGVADVVISFFSFNIIMFLYRLYYDTWYIVMYLLISGFLYTFLAVPFGIRLGFRLKAAY